MSVDSSPQVSFSPTNSRDLRLDLLRGAALLCMHTDHFRHNVLAAWTPRNFGFSDMAEVFVFLSGCVCGVVYGRVLRAEGFLACQRKALVRVGQLILACGVTLLSLALVQDWRERSDGPSALSPTQQAVHDRSLIDDFQFWRSVVGGPQVMGILLLYGVLLVALPALLWLKERNWRLLLGASLWVYGAVQVDWTDAKQLGAWSELTAFHPLAWQLMFVLGLLLYEPCRSVREKRYGHWILLIAAVVLIEIAFLCRFYWAPDELPLIDKTTLGPLRVLHLLSLMVLAEAILPESASRFWKSWPIRSLVLCGQNSWLVFCSGSVLIVLVEALLLRAS